jgi:Lrp/AsnC family transcriptional regulator for asnA, asnC and gidA
MSKFRLDEVDHQILDMLIIQEFHLQILQKKLLISAGTVHVRVKKMEDAGIIMGSSLVLDYDKLGYSFIVCGFFSEQYVANKICFRAN